MRILLVLVAVTGAATAPATPAADCQPYRYRTADPSAATAGGAPSFFLEVRYRSAPPSYVLGTFHSADPAVLATWDRTLLVAAASSVRSFVVERLDDGLADGPDPRLLEDDRDLRQLLAREEGLYEAAIEMLESYGLPYAQIDRFQPWYVSALLQQAPALRFPGNDEILDVYLRNEAERLGFAMRALETIADVGSYYERGLSTADQVRLLWEAVCNRAANERSIAEQTAAYVADDVGAMYRQLERLQGSDSGLAGRLTDVFVRQRNERFWELLEPELMAGGAFVAIGNLHLFGESGLWHQLVAASEAGFIVGSVNLDNLNFVLEPDDLEPAVKWVLDWARRELEEPVTRASFAGLRIRPRSITQLRAELCPGRRCEIDATYFIEERTVYATTGTFAELMASAMTPAFYLQGREVRKGGEGGQGEASQAGGYAESILIRELVRHLLYVTQYPQIRTSRGPGLGQRGMPQADPAAPACIRNRVLHRASLAQQEYLRSAGSGRTAKLFPLISGCGAGEN